jgi:CheY-like chemotaxis protein
MNTILIIDDNKNYRANLTELLNLEQYVTLDAENGLIGLQMIHQHSPNLILCDVDMPVMNGIDVLRTIKSDAKFSTIPFVILSGGRDEEDVKIAQDLGATAYLKKPIAITKLLLAIANFLSPKASLLARG